MGRRVDYVRKKFAPMLSKTLVNALAHRIGREFPRIGGPRIRTLCAELVLEVMEANLRPREHVRHGQALWLAVHVDDPPARNKRIADTLLVPVILDLSTPEDIEARIDRRRPQERLEAKLVRVCKQAYDQKGLLSNCDLAELFHLCESEVARVLNEYEDRTGTIVPRRANLHDVGTSLTHKRVICRKRYLEGKTTDQIARETYHTEEAVYRYLGHYDRVRHCQREGMDAEEIAYTLNCSVGLVKEYLALDEELEAESG